MLYVCILLEVHFCFRMKCCGAILSVWIQLFHQELQWEVSLVTLYMRDTFTLGRACDELVMVCHSFKLQKKTVMVFSQCGEAITLNNVSLEFIPILHKVRWGKTDKSGVFCLSTDLNCQSGICASQRVEKNTIFIDNLMQLYVINSNLTSGQRLG